MEPGAHADHDEAARRVGDHRAGRVPGLLDSPVRSADHGAQTPADPHSLPVSGSDQRPAEPVQRPPHSASAPTRGSRARAGGGGLRFIRAPGELDVAAGRSVHVKVSQVLCAAGPVDAVTNQALACRGLFEQWGWGGKDYAALSASGVDRRAIRPLQALNAAPDEFMLLHYSGYARGLERLFDSRRQSVLISHNITPARFFWDNDPLAAVRCELGREQLAELSRGVGTLAGVSAYNANELRLMSGRTAAVIPVLFERDRLPPAGDAPTGPPTVLFVGR